MAQVLRAAQHSPVLAQAIPTCSTVSADRPVFTASRLARVTRNMLCGGGIEQACHVSEVVAGEQ